MSVQCGLCPKMCILELGQAGYKNVLVSAGYANLNSLKKLFKYIDLKSMSDSFYQDICKATFSGFIFSKKNGFIFRNN